MYANLSEQQYKVKKTFDLNPQCLAPALPLVVFCCFFLRVCCRFKKKMPTVLHFPCANGLCNVISIHREAEFIASLADSRLIL